jgi:hypothetical protein
VDPHGETLSSDDTAIMVRGALFRVKSFATGYTLPLPWQFIQLILLNLDSLYPLVLSVID